MAVRKQAQRAETSSLVSPESQASQSGFHEAVQLWCRGRELHADAAFLAQLLECPAWKISISVRYHVPSDRRYALVSHVHQGPPHHRGRVGLTDHETGLTESSKILLTEHDIERAGGGLHRLVGPDMSTKTLSSDRCEWKPVVYFTGNLFPVSIEQPETE